jgi:hypothetical protein
MIPTLFNGILFSGSWPRQRTSWPIVWQPFCSELSRQRGKTLLVRYYVTLWRNDDKLWRRDVVISWWCDCVTLWFCDNRPMWRYDNVTLGQWDVTTMGRYDNVTLGQWDVTTMWRCALWCHDDVMIQRCEVVMMWLWNFDDVTIRWHVVTTWRCDDTMMWRYDDVTIRWCDDTMMWRYDDVTKWRDKDLKIHFFSTRFLK